MDKIDNFFFSVYGFMYSVAAFVMIALAVADIFGLADTINFVEALIWVMILSSHGALTYKYERLANRYGQLAQELRQ